jgi:prevent-host-death family protein
MIMKTMTASVASKEFGRYLDAAQREPVIVTKQNRPVAVTVSFQDWEEFTNLRIERGLSLGLEDLKHGRFEDVSDANTLVRLARFKKRNHDAI